VPGHDPDKLKPKSAALDFEPQFRGRQGFKGRTHLVSPAMAAAAAIAGILVDIKGLALTPIPQPRAIPKQTR